LSILNRYPFLLIMSAIKYRELSLTEIIEESNLVVEVKFVKKYREEVAMARKDGSDVPIPPAFVKKGNLFRVMNVLKNKGDFKVGDQIKVPEENWRRSLSQYKETHLDGPVKSFTVLDYATEIKSISKATVLFLHYFQDMYELTARHSYEGNTAMEKVKILIETE
jgi:hypothetical protein